MMDGLRSRPGRGRRALTIPYPVHLRAGVRFVFTIEGAGTPMRPGDTLAFASGERTVRIAGSGVLIDVFARSGRTLSVKEPFEWARRSPTTLTQAESSPASNAVRAHAQPAHAGTSTWASG
jgi:hypothetical protein